ncbi:uncharacterized protein LAESUDRAFT_238562 [Laetiporus sulphureus 93-53]|uniref:BTB domain-containing protein n=1 Tax=Laetiporus sulphureus 93-53 TaxID=1314785 RepID=A0A165DP13_9APHY|nr:uncharacterized protein LAESUDRAFT_238562 [Laetiporus sulphureus 93-53]KZT05306.1 hypothetical protein LAESUDRAFT_238562 [Laetiporus sulphureus 93-53]
MQSSAMDRNATVDEVKMSERFRAPDADLTILSSDGVLFKVHRRNLEMHSECFPGEDPVISDSPEVVALTEKASILELLFQYMYRQPQPDLTELDFYEFALLAEAAEKYGVYPALEVCKLQMRNAIPDYPLTVLGYAARHGHNKLADEVAPRTVGMLLEFALHVLGPSVFIQWYREALIQALLLVPTMTGTLLHEDGLVTCEEWQPFQNAVLLSFRQDFQRFLNVAAVFTDNIQLLRSCDHCRHRAARWQAHLESMFSDILPKFSSVRCT